MLETIRNATKSWLALIVVGLLVVSFALWGVQDIFTTDLNDPVAIVDDTDISAQDFSVAFNQQFNATRSRIGGQFTQADALAIGLEREVLNNIIQRTLVDAVADQFDLRVSDERLSAEIRTNPAFFGVSGQFSQQAFNEALRNVGFSQESFAQGMRDDLERNQLLSALTSGTFMPSEMVLSLFEYAFEERSMEYFLLPADAAGEIADANGEALQAFYLDNLSNYRLPEYRSLTILEISPANMLDSIEISDDDITRTYEIRSNRYQTPERRTVDQLAFGSGADANTALAALEAGSAFEDVGGVYANIGSVAVYEMNDAASGEAAFALTDPGHTGVVPGALAFAILRVIDITPGTTTPIEDVRDEIRLDLATQAAEEEIYSIYNQAADMRAGGEDLAVIAQQLGQSATIIEAVDISGFDRNGELREDLTAMGDMMFRAFSLQEGDDSNFQTTEENGYFVVRVDAIIPASVHPFEDVADRVANDWTREQVRVSLNTMARELAARINAGEDFTTVAAEAGRVVRATPSSLRRGGATEIFTSDVLNQLFRFDIGTAVPGAIQLGSTHIVARVTDVQSADVAAAQADIATLQNQFNQELANEIISSFVDNEEANANVRINEVVLNQVLNLQNQ